MDPRFEHPRLYAPAGYCSARARARARAWAFEHVHACMWGCSIINHTAEVSDVQSIAEIHQQVHIKHTGNIHDNIYTVYGSGVYTNISYPLPSAEADSSGSAVFLFGLYHERSR